MTSAVANTGSQASNLFPPVNIGGNLIPDREPFSDHLDREIDRTDNDARERAPVDTKSAREREPSEPDHDDTAIRERDGTDDQTAVRDAPEREAAAEDDAPEQRSEPTDQDSKPEEGRSATEQDTPDRPQNQEASGADPEAVQATASAQPVAEAPQGAEVVAVETKVSAAQTPDEAALLSTNPAAVEVAAATKESLPRVRKGEARIPSIARAGVNETPANGKSPAQVNAAGATAAKAGAGEVVGQIKAVGTDAPASTAPRADQNQFSGLLQPAVQAAPAALAAQPAAMQPLTADGMTGGIVELDGKPVGQILQGTDTVSAAKATVATASKPALTANQATVQVAFELNKTAQQGLNRLSMQLHPAELGRVDVKIEVGHDGRALAVVMVDRQETLDLLQRDARTLERALTDAGLQADSGSLSFSLRQDPQNGQATADGGSAAGGGAEETGDSTMEADGNALPRMVSDRALDISV